MLSPTASSYSMTQLTGSTEYNVRLQAIAGAQRSRHVNTVFTTSKDENTCRHTARFFCFVFNSLCLSPTIEINQTCWCLCFNSERSGDRLRNSPDAKILLLLTQIPFI